MTVTATSRKKKVSPTDIDDLFDTKPVKASPVKEAISKPVKRATPPPVRLGSKQSMGGSLDLTVNTSTGLQTIQIDKDSDIAKALQALLGNDIRSSSELDDPHVPALAVLQTVAKKYNSEVLKQLCVEFLMHRCSRAGKSRADVVSAFKAIEDMSRARQSNDRFGDDRYRRD